MLISAAQGKKQTLNWSLSLFRTTHQRSVKNSFSNCATSFPNISQPLLTTRSMVLATSRPISMLKSVKRIFILWTQCAHGQYTLRPISAFQPVHFCIFVRNPSSWSAPDRVSKIPCGIIYTALKLTITRRVRGGLKTRALETLELSARSTRR